MKYALLFLAIIIVAYCTWEYIRISRFIQVSGALVADAVPFSRTEGNLRLLVLGDSTAVGVGSTAPETVAGRLADELDASVENYAVSGAKTRDIAQQFSHKTTDAYDLVLIQVGANDIIRFSALGPLHKDIRAALKDARSVSDKVVLITAGKVGQAPFFPNGFGWLWTMRAHAVREDFMVAAQEHGAAYVDLYSAKDPFATDPQRYYAADGLHLTGDGYGFWYEETLKVIHSHWPELAYEAGRN